MEPELAGWCDLLMSFTCRMQVTDMLFDSYAMRCLVFQPPTEPPRLLSSLMISEECSLHRFMSRAGAEEVILTVTMQLSEGLVGQFRGSPKVTPIWRLKSVTGESDWGDDLPTRPGLSVGPEVVVQSQLEALRWDSLDINECMSMGPWST